MLRELGTTDDVIENAFRYAFFGMAFGDCVGVASAVLFHGRVGSRHNERNRKTAETHSHSDNRRSLAPIGFEAQYLLANECHVDTRSKRDIALRISFVL